MGHICGFTPPSLIDTQGTKWAELGNVEMVHIWHIDATIAALVNEPSCVVPRFEELRVLCRILSRIATGRKRTLDDRARQWSNPKI